MNRGIGQSLRLSLHIQLTCLPLFCMITFAPTCISEKRRA